MNAKDLVWTIVISVFVTCYVMWRMHSVLGEKEADDPPEKGLAAERGEDDSVNAGEGPFSCPQEGVSEPRRRFSGCDCGALTVDGFPAFLRESTQDKGADSPFGDIGRRAQRQGKARRKASSHSRAAPGGLERSIQWRMAGRGFALDAEVYVAANAEAGKYAKRIHDEKGKTWRKRGPGTVAKGPRADDKYILRAVQQAAKDFPSLLQKRLGR